MRARGQFSLCVFVSRRAFTFRTHRTARACAGSKTVVDRRLGNARGMSATCEVGLLLRIVLRNEQEADYSFQY